MGSVGMVAAGVKVGVADAPARIRMQAMAASTIAHAIILGAKGRVDWDIVLLVCDKIDNSGVEVGGGWVLMSLLSVHRVSSGVVMSRGEYQC